MGRHRRSTSRASPASGSLRRAGAACGAIGSILGRALSSCAWRSSSLSGSNGRAMAVLYSKPDPSDDRRNSLFPWETAEDRPNPTLALTSRLGLRSGSRYVLSVTPRCSQKTTHSWFRAGSRLSACNSGIDTIAEDPTAGSNCHRRSREVDHERKRRQRELRHIRFRRTWRRRQRHHRSERKRSGRRRHRRRRGRRRRCRGTDQPGRRRSRCAARRRCDRERPR